MPSDMGSATTTAPSSPRRDRTLPRRADLLLKGEVKRSGATDFTSRNSARRRSHHRAGNSRCHSYSRNLVMILRAVRQRVARAGDSLLLGDAAAGVDIDQTGSSVCGAPHNREPCCLKRCRYRGSGERTLGTGKHLDFRTGGKNEAIDSTVSAADRRVHGRKQ